MWEVNQWTKQNRYRHIIVRRAQKPRYHRCKSLVDNIVRQNQKSDVIDIVVPHESWMKRLEGYRTCQPKSIQLQPAVNWAMWQGAELLDQTTKRSHRCADVRGKPLGKAESTKEKFVEPKNLGITNNVGTPKEHRRSSNKSLWEHNIVNSECFVASAWKVFHAIANKDHLPTTSSNLHYHNQQEDKRDQKAAGISPQWSFTVSNMS